MEKPVQTRLLWMWVKPVFFLSEKRNMKREGGTTRGLSLIFRLVAFSGPLVPPIFFFVIASFCLFPNIIYFTWSALVAVLRWWPPHQLPRWPHRWKLERQWTGSDGHSISICSQLPCFICNCLPFGCLVLIHTQLVNWTMQEICIQSTQFWPMTLRIVLDAGPIWLFLISSHFVGFHVKISK